MTDRHRIEVTVVPVFIPAESDPASDRYVFAYTVTIYNAGPIGARLMSRHWIITDGGDRVREVRGPGVLGEQPYLSPGTRFRYTSSAMLSAPVGQMRGCYQMIDDDGVEFDAVIPAFTLSIPRTLH